MLNQPNQNIPASGLKGLSQNWRQDLSAAVSVALVAMPLALGIAVASGVPPMSGITSAIIGGVVTTFFRSSHVAINGPAAGLIAVILGASAGLNDGTDQTLNYVLAAIVVSGAIQILLGLMKLGRLAELFPSAVIHGLLAAIGVIIIAKQLHVALGTTAAGGNTVETLFGAIKNLPQANPFVAIISVLGVLLLAYHARISYKLFHFLPAPIWVLILALPFVYAFDFFTAREISLLGRSYEVGPQFLISIPDSILDSLLYPNFSKINTGAFWLAVISITLIASVETLASTKAVDKLDSHKRKTNYDKDLVGVGVSTMISGLVGGLPIITVIVRSTVNVHNNAQTKWSNFYHGILLLIFVLIAAPVIQKIPLAALAAILVFTGYKLASPRVFRETYEQGYEQLLFFGSTLLITLYTNLLYGIFWGIVITLTVHILLTRVPIPTFFKMAFASDTKLYQKDDGSCELKIKGIANFLSTLRINKILEKVRPGQDVKINLATAKLVDFTVQENLQEFRRVQQNTGAQVSITGLDQHISTTNHRFALKSLISDIPISLSPRQKRLKNMAVANGWSYQEQAEWNTSYLQNFKFFDSRPIEYKANIMSSEYPDNNVRWEICDITFDEGALLAKEVYRTTVEMIFLNKPMPRFVLEREGIFDKVFSPVLAFTGQKDINIPQYPRFSNRFVLKGEDREAIKAFFTDDIVRFLDSEDVYHIESNGEALLVFRSLNVAKSQNIEEMIRFSGKFVNRLLTTPDNGEVDS
ncbi:MAG: SulP family inorganic anion transporter [Cyclobacteriaceae bacterium]|nr:SulP family inorganic anion transporter [Cyclobacteriaceae bacterium]